VGIVLAPLLLGERITIWQVVGTLLVLAGVALTTRAPFARSGAS
jgi:drug/metabolite transporter (DMT)-like permease